MFDVKDIYSAKDLVDALTYKKNDRSSIILAGGTDVFVKARNLMYQDQNLLSLKNLDSLNYIELDKDENLHIGALSTFSNIKNNELIIRLMPTLIEAAKTIGSPQIRNVATIGGNICVGNTCSDAASTLLAFDAYIVLASLRSNKITTRKLYVRDFYIGPGKTSINSDEIATEFIISKSSYKDTFGTYIKYSSRAALDISTLNCSANVVLNKDKNTLIRLRIAYGVAGPYPLRVKNVEEKYSNVMLYSNLAEDIANDIVDEICPRDSWRASKEFRLHIAREITKRAVNTSILLAKEH